ncbi:MULTISPECIES: PKD-like family lipoprotein [unclassified Sphingobacterium]|uniref:PKD-like family lipoprotein n=1 Tax=unclassified Sphingobacterium TaxID=2609468 RepID=UPI0010482591|nr:MULTISPECIES: PKD-like family lipoprotein [unclassified Sphingobacterium]MCS3556550.1 hypothetical protein [Sphingobacterium sp. JUb21]TCQ99846.1 PKD family protein [Sphingobacterium sp. JUb20]
MKYLIIVLFTGLLNFSCNKDTGNYDYLERADLVVLDNKSLVNLKVGVPDTLFPLIQNDGETIKPMDYSYQWAAYTNTPNDYHQLDVQTPFLTSADLVNAGMTGSFNVAFRATQKENGVTVQSLYRVLAVNATQEGWLLLCERDGHSEVSFLSGIGNYDALIAVSNGKDIAPFLTGRPVSSAANHGGISQQNTLLEGNFLLLSTTDRILILKGEDLSYQKGLSDRVTMELKPMPHSPVRLFNGINADASKENNIYSFGFGNASGFDPFDTAIPMNDYTIVQNVTQGKSLPQDIFPVSPILIPTGRVPTNRPVLFDLEKSLFINSGRFLGMSVGTEPVPIVFDKPFDLSGFELMSGISSLHSSGNPLITALMRNKAREYYILSFLTNGILLGANKINDQRLVEAQYFAIDQRTEYLVYNVGSRIYGYSYRLNKSRELLNFGDEEISVLSFEQISLKGPISDTNRRAVYQRLQEGLVVCTFDKNNPGSGGTFRQYRIPLGSQPIEEMTKQSGFSRIQDITFNRIF